MVASPKTLESNLWKWVKKGCRGQFATGALYMERMENAVGSGYPDVDMCLSGQAAKIELKTVARPVRESTNLAIKFQPSQIPWHRKFALALGTSFVLIQVGSSSAARRYLVTGYNAAIVEQGVPESVLSELSVTPFDATAATIVATAAHHAIY